MAENYYMNGTGKFIALVLAADRTSNDPVTNKTGVACKALAPVGGIPMIIRVLDALEESGMIRTIVLCGPPEPALSACPELQRRIESGRVRWLPNLDSPSRSAVHGLSQLENGAPVLLTTADHALLTPEIVRFFLNASLVAGGDATVGLVRHEVVTAAFPGVRRTVTRLRGGDYCGCNLYAILNQQGRDLLPFWQGAENLRKQPLRLIMRILGPLAIVSYIFRSLTLERALGAVSAKSGVRIRPVVLPYPHAGVDVDKPEDLELVEAILAGTESLTGAGNKPAG